MHPIIGRIQQSLITLVAAVSLGFVLIHQLPSGPLDILFGLYDAQTIRNMDPRTIQELTKQYTGFSSNEPLYIQYLQYWESLLQLDFGTSVIYQEPVFEVLAPAVPWTVLVSTLAMVLNVTIGVSLGAYMAYREGSRFDIGATFVSVIVSAVPYYIVAILLLIFLGFGTGLFPNGGRYADSITPGFRLDFILSILHHAALPVLSLTVTSFAALGLRAHSIRVLGSDYIRVARLRGLAERRIVFHYVLRNSILPFYTSFVVGLVGLVSGSVITEKIFQYVGVGWYTFKGANAGDIPLVLGTFTFFTFATVIMLLVVDLTYSYVDPRAEGVGADESF